MANPERAQQRQGGGGSVSLSSSVGRLLWSAELGARRGEGTVGFLVCARTTWLPLRASIVCAVACGTIPPFERGPVWWTMLDGRNGASSRVWCAMCGDRDAA